ncbi:MAG: hypothetical protein ACR2JG_06385, partial [Geodermatophilaceae bacterium]
MAGLPLGVPAGSVAQLSRRTARSRGEPVGVVGEADVTTREHRGLDAECYGKCGRRTFADLAGRLGSDADHDAGR